MTMIYALKFSLDDFEAGTKLTFNRSLQRFETLDHKRFISNHKSAANPGFIINYMEVRRAKPKRRTFYIPF